MAIETVASIKANFQTGDRPTQADFVNLIDTAIPEWQVAITSAVVNGGRTGVLEIEASASATTRATGAVGIQLLATGTTAAAQQALGGGTAGRTIFEAITTASVQTGIGGGAVGIQILGAPTTAAVNDILGGLVTVSAATPAEVSAAADVSADYVTPGTMVHHPAVPKVIVTFNGSAQASIMSSFGVSAVTRTNPGDYTITFKNAFANANYSMSGTVRSNSGIETTSFLAMGSATPTVSACQVQTAQGGGGSGDRPRIMVQIWGDLA